MGYISMSVVAFLVVLPVVLATDTATIPENRAQIPQWFKANVKPFSQRKGTLDPALEAAEASRRIITVSYYIIRFLVRFGIVFTFSKLYFTV